MTDAPGMPPEVLFERAQELPPAERAAFLERVCGDDPALLEEIRSLLAYAGEAEAFFDALLPVTFPLEPDPLIGRTVAHYELVEELGSGGMGVVYKARDLHLDRFVAVKFLSASWSRDADSKRRFIREAKAASALDHPNVCPVYDVDEFEDRLYIVMAYCEGETLAEKIERCPLPVEEAVDLALQIVRGLEKTHARGIVHRDLKPGNVIVTTDGTARIVDFGIAKLSADTRITRHGAVMGSVAYMSPEQARVDEVDHRTDLWSLGVVLYEMLTGARPFRSTNEPGLLYEICHTDPAPPDALRPGLPAGLERIVERCLQKDPGNRYQNAGDLRADLEFLVSGKKPAGFYRRVPIRRPRVTPRCLASAAVALLLLAAVVTFVFNRDRFFPRSETVLAVLPFYTPDDPADQAFLSGLQEDLIGKLTLLEDDRGSIWVIPSSELRSRDIRHPSDAHFLLGTTRVITLEVDRTADSVSVQLHLIDTSSPIPRHVADVTRSGHVGIFSQLRDDLLFELIETMGLRVGSRDREVLVAGGSTNARANELYLEGSGFLQRLELEANIDTAIALLERALVYDPRFASAHALLGEAFWQKYENTRDQVWIDRALQSAARASELDRLSPQVRTTRALILDRTGRDEEAVREYRYALTLDPENAAALRGLGKVYADLQHFSSAIAVYQEAIRIRPQDWRAHNGIGVVYYDQGQFEEAATFFQKVIDLVPGSSIGYENLALVHMEATRWEEALQLYRRAINIDPYYMTYENLSMLHYLNGRFELAVATIDSALSLNDTDYFVWGLLGTYYYDWGPEHHEHARQAIQAALELLEGDLIFNETDPVFLSEKALFLSMAGDPATARAILDRLPIRKTWRWDTQYTVAEAYERAGDRDAALEWLERALNSGYPAILLPYHHGMKSLREDPRYERLVLQAKI